MSLFPYLHPGRGSVAILGAVLLAGPALAQAPAAKPPAATPAPVPTEPGTTTASYGDWVLRCQRLGPPEKRARLCEVAQAVQVQGQAAPVAQVAIGRAPGEAAPRVTALLPVAVSFPSSVRLALGDKNGKPSGTKGDEADDAKAGGLDLAWRRCLPGGCLADGPAADAILKRWRTAEPPGRILFRDAEGQEIAIPLSLRGLGPALDALARERD